MAGFTELIKERQGLAALNTGLLNVSVNGSTNSGTLDMSLFNRGQFIVGVGSGGTGNAYLKQCANANGTGATNLQMSPQNAAALTANTLVTLECRSDQMTARYLLVQIVTDLAAQAFAIGEGFDRRYAPTTPADNASVLTRLVCNL